MALPIYIYVDVDDTFVRSAGSKRIAIPATIEHIKQLYQEGAVLYCWSSGGAEYAKASAEEFGIADCFVQFLPKPNIVIDDQVLTAGPRFMMSHPNACSSSSVETYTKKINGN